MFGWLGISSNPKPETIPPRRSQSPTNLNYVPDHAPTPSFFGKLADTATGAARNAGQRLGIVSIPEPQPQPPIEPDPLTEDDKRNIGELCGLMAGTFNGNDDYQIEGHHPLTFTAAFLCRLFSEDLKLNSAATHMEVNQFVKTYQRYNRYNQLLIPPLDDSKQRLTALLHGVDGFVNNLQTSQTIRYQHIKVPREPSVFERQVILPAAGRLMEHVKYQLALIEFEYQRRQRMSALASEGGRSKRSKRVKRSKRSKRVKRSKRISTKRH